MTRPTTPDSHVPGHEQAPEHAPTHNHAHGHARTHEASAASSEEAHRVLKECPDCGLIQLAAQPPPGGTVQCPRCDAILRRRRTDSLNRALALAVTALALLAVAATTPFLSFRLGGQERETTMATMPGAFALQGMTLLTWLVLITTVLAPLAKLLATIGILVGLRNGAPRGTLATLARWRTWIAPWSMVEVFLLGAFVAYTRLAGLAYVEVGPAFYAVFLLMLAMVATDALLDEDAMWDAIRPARAEPIGSPFAPLLLCDTCGLASRAREGAPCPRCGAGLGRRKPNSVRRTWAFLIAGAALYVPANIYPVMTVIRLGRGGPHTILGGALELLHVGLWPLALLVFVASVVVPLFKLIGLIVLLVSVQRRWTGGLRGRTRLYRVVDVIGRWSMIDVFMVAILVALVQQGAIAAVLPGIGVAAFAAVVVATMLAAGSFDPRLMWDAAEERCRQSAQARGAAPDSLGTEPPAGPVSARTA